MSAYPEQPFSDFEERYLLAEILKRSSFPTASLLSTIRDAGIEPAWTEIALPNGRSLSSCQHAYNALLTRTQQHPQVPLQIQNPTLKPLKRPYSMGDAASGPPLTREIQPRPPAFTTVNGIPQPTPGPLTMSPIEPPRKKRGRPTKSEYERRQAEARERGEVWPKPRSKNKAQRPSTEGAEPTPSSTGAGPSATGEEAGGEGRGSVATAGSGEESSVTSAPPTAMMYPPSTPGSAHPPFPSGQRRGPPYEGLMQPAGQVPQQHETRPMDAEAGPEARITQVLPPQNILADLRPLGPMSRGPPLQPRGPVGQFAPHGSALPYQMPNYPPEERPVAPLRTQQPQ